MKTDFEFLEYEFIKSIDAMYITDSLGQTYLPETIHRNVEASVFISNN